MADLLRFRQVHLDFHTSPLIPGIGEQFDPDEFADTLAKAHVDSITCFARCHHGYIYYDTKLNPERHHPHLKRNLLAEQIAACHARGIRVPIYTTVQWDHFTAQEHPEWLTLSDQGVIIGTKPYEAGFYRTFCLNSPYVDFLKAHVREIFEMNPVDGLFFDIVSPHQCSCPRCIAEMGRRGIDPTAESGRKAFAQQIVNEFRLDMTAFVRKLSKDATIFYNSSHIGPQQRPAAKAYSHFEIESLPSGGWGYMHFPLTMRFARNLGLDCMGMTGKFHTTWGDFGSFKNPAALQFECYQMLALGAKCSIGDQLHPSGKICPTTYELIGSVYAEVEKKEPWCEQAVPANEIAILTPEEYSVGPWPHVGDAMRGSVRMLQELRAQFDVADSQSDLSKYRLLVLPDELPVDENISAKLQAFVRAGGSIIATHKSGLKPSGDGFASDLFGVAYQGDAPFSPDFIQPRPALGQGLPDVQHVLYKKGLQVQPLPGAEVLADVYVPYFNRTWEHFCSHRHTPSSNQLGYPGAVRKGSVIYFAHPLFSQYNQNAPRWCKQFIANALTALLGELMVKVDGPSSLLASVNDQPHKKRRVLHLLHYIPERRCQDFDVIEDVIPLHDLAVSVAVPKNVAKVTAVPEGQALPFRQAKGRVEFTLPKLNGHQMIEIAY